MGNIVLSDLLALAAVTAEMHDAADEFAAAYLSHEAAQYLVEAACWGGAPESEYQRLVTEAREVLPTSRDRQRRLGRVHERWVAEYECLRGVTYAWAAMRGDREVHQMLERWLGDGAEEPWPALTKRLHAASKDVEKAASAERGKTHKWVGHESPEVAAARAHLKEARSVWDETVSAWTAAYTQRHGVPYAWAYRQCCNRLKHWRDL